MVLRTLVNFKTLSMATVLAAATVAGLSRPASAIGPHTVRLICSIQSDGLNVVWSISMDSNHEKISQANGDLLFGSGDAIPLSNSGTGIERGHTIRLFPPAQTLRGQALSSIMPTDPEDFFVSLSATVTTISSEITNTPEQVGPFWADCQ